MVCEYKTVVVRVGDHGESRASVEVAARIAARCDGYLIAIHTLGQSKDHVVEQQDRAMAECEWVRDTATAAGVPCEWLPVQGEGVARLLDVGRSADLIVVGGHRRVPADVSSSNRQAAEIAARAGRPLLVVPTDLHPAVVGTRIVVAWNGTRESARAVADALPILAWAKNVTVIRGTESDEKAHVVVPIKGLIDALARHQIKSDLMEFECRHSDVGQKIIRYCHDVNADLLVMGAFGHSRAREVVLGGVTQTVLDTMSLPVLMSH